jgi:hypothetical protein
MRASVGVVVSTRVYVCACVYAYDCIMQMQMWMWHACMCMYAMRLEIDCMCVDVYGHVYVDVVMQVHVCSTCLTQLSQTSSMKLVLRLLQNRMATGMSTYYGLCQIPSSHLAPFAVWI